MRVARVLLLMIPLLAGPLLAADTVPAERTFPQSKAVVEKNLKQLQPSLAGRLPVLEGFVTPGNRSLDQFQRGYYQCSIEVTPTSAGSLVRVTAKITAWFESSDPSKSGYQLLPSNGRLESDLLDQLTDLLARQPHSPAAANSNTNASAKQPDIPAFSAPVPQADKPLIAKKPAASPASPFKLGSPTTEDLATQRAITDRKTGELEKEAKNLEEILRNQAHPSNLVAVRKDGTPVLVSPNEGAKLLFRATAEDEFEVLDMNANWVHIRISGLSRGWILRSNVELPDAANSPSTPDSVPEASSSAAAPKFQVENEEVASFPGDWTPLRGKTVKIVSVKKANERASGGGEQARLDFAKSVFDREYSELAKSSTTMAGVVVIFDSADGGMMATTLPVLQEWKSGALSDEALWRRCYFDPPELSPSSRAQ